MITLVLCGFMYVCEEVSDNCCMDGFAVAQKLMMKMSLASN